VRSKIVRAAVAFALSASVGLGLPFLAPAAALTSTPNDPLFAQQWALNQIGAPAAWGTSTGAGVTIGVVDTGIDFAHQDLRDKVVGAATCMNTGGQASRCTTGPGAGQDDNGHGTFVAGEAAATTNNGVGIAGVAPGANLMVAKVLDNSGGGSADDILAGIEWLVDHGAGVINLSLGPADTSILGGGGGILVNALEYAWQHNVVPVVAAGNSNFLGLGVLGNSGYGNVDALVVGATGPNGAVASYSSPLAGTKWAVVAPGGDGNSCQTNPGACIISTYWVNGQSNVYAYEIGTSMATPMVSGLVALLLGMGQTPQQAVSTVLQTTNRVSGCGCAGEISPVAAVRVALAHGGRRDLAMQGASPTTPYTAPPAAPVVVVNKTQTPARVTSRVPQPSSTAPRPSNPSTTTAPSTTAHPPPPTTGAPSADPAHQALGAGLPAVTKHRPMVAASVAGLVALVVAGLALLGTLRQRPG
jgi:subtilisin family serine protease